MSNTEQDQQRKRYEALLALNTPNDLSLGSLETFDDTTEQEALDEFEQAQAEYYMTLIKESKIPYDFEMSSKHWRAVKKCANLYLLGYTTTEIVDMLKNDKRAMKTSYEIARLARKFLENEILTKETEIRDDLLAKYNYLYRSAMQKNDLRSAKSILDSIAKLTQTIKTDITSNGQQIETIRLVEIRKEDE